jgi:hypothetical protein
MKIKKNRNRNLNDGSCEITISIVDGSEQVTFVVPCWGINEIDWPAALGTYMSS